MKYLYTDINDIDIKLLLKELNVTNSDDIFVHGSTLDSSNYQKVTESIFQTGINKNTNNVAPFMSILSTISLLSTSYDLGNQILDYHIGNTTFVLRIPKEYKGLYFGRVDQKYACRVSGNQDICATILDLLELEKIPSEFIVCSIKKSNKQKEKYDVLINPKYFEIDNDTKLKENIVDLVDKHYNSLSRDVVKDYMNIEKLEQEKFDLCMDVLSAFLLEDKEFIDKIYLNRERKENNRR